MGGFAGAGGLLMRDGGGVRLDKRAAVVAAAAAAAGVALGYWAGAVPGVLAALAGLVPAVVWQFAVSRQGSADARRARLAAAGAAFAVRVVEVPAADAGGGGVARYLRPEAEVVPFWPRRELDELAGWVVAGELAAASPDRYRPDLAASLTDLSAILDVLGRTDEAEKIRNDASLRAGLNPPVTG